MKTLYFKNANHSNKNIQDNYFCENKFQRLIPKSQKFNSTELDNKIDCENIFPEIIFK